VNLEPDHVWYKGHPGFRSYNVINNLGTRGLSFLYPWDFHTLRIVLHLLSFGLGSFLFFLYWCYNCCSTILYCIGERIVVYLCTLWVSFSWFLRFIHLGIQTSSSSIWAWFPFVVSYSCADISTTSFFVYYFRKYANVYQWMSSFWCIIDVSLYLTPLLCIHIF